MYKYSDIQQRCAEENVKIFLTSFSQQMINNSVIFDDLDEFFEYVKFINVKHVFVMVIPDEVEDYLISESVIDEVLDRYDKKIVLENIMDLVVEYNKKIGEMQIDYPAMIVVACFYEGHSFMICLRNMVVSNEEELLDPEVALEEMIEEKESEIEKAKDIRKKRIAKQKELLENFILSDEDFYMSTNAHRRYVYTERLFKEKLDAQYEELKEYWSTPYGLPTQGAKDFVEDLWRKFGKNRVKS